MKVFVVGVLPSSLINFRGDLLLKLSQKSDKVFALSNGATSLENERVRALGCEPISYSVARNGLNPIKDILTLWNLRSLLKQKSPHKQLSYTIKPIIWGGLAARNQKVEHYAMVTGLGYAFQPGGKLKSVLIWLAHNLYKSALRDAKAIIFQNPDNMQVFIEQGIASANKCHLVRGSGVNLDRFKPTTPVKEHNFLLIARLLGDKGIREYVKAAEIVKLQYPNATFDLVGPEDSSPDGIKIDEVQNWVRDGIINYHGATSDVRPFIRNCRYFVLPSYHEGLPRTVLEAMAMQRAIITTDVPGCRETVMHGINGLLVEKGNINELAEKMRWMIENPHSVDVMAEESLKMVRDKFDVHKVNAEILRIMEINEPEGDIAGHEKTV